MAHTIANFVKPFAFTASLALLAAVSGIAPASADAASPAPLRTIPNPVPQQADNFGRNMMATPNGYIVTGSQHADVNGVVDCGAAYVINAATGQVIHNLYNPEPRSDDGFGAFAWAGDTRAIVSAFWKAEGSATHAGRAYIYDLASGLHTLTIHNPTPGTEDLFGYAVAMLGDKAIISARGDDTNGLDSGAVYIYDSISGALLKTLLNPEPTTQDNFGYSVVGLGSDKVVAGSPNYTTNGVNCGIAFIMDATTGAVLHRLVNPDPTAGGYFGFQVRAHGNDVLVGAPGQQKAYLFDGNTGALKLRMKNPDVRPGAAFGSTVGSAGNYILVGNPTEPFDAPQIGRAYLFSASTGKLIHTFENPTPEAEDRFGVSVVGVGDEIAISADQQTVAGQKYSGMLYIYGMPETAAQDWALYQ